VKVKRHFWHCYIQYLLSDYCYLLLAIFDLLSMTCYMLLAICILLSETCYYLQKLVPFARCCTSRNFFRMYCSANLFLLNVVPYPLIKVSNTCVYIREALDSVALAVPRGHNSYQVITVSAIIWLLQSNQRPTTITKTSSSIIPVTST